MKKLNIPMNNDNRNVTPLGNGMHRDASNNSFMGGARENSANRIVEDKHLGPMALKNKVNQPGAPGMPRPISRYQQNLSAPSKRESTKGANDDYSDEDYEDNFDDANDNGEDAMDKIRKAMEKEKLKA